MIESHSQNEVTEGGDKRHYAGFWIRALASLVDDVFVVGSSLALTYIALLAAYFILKPAPTFGASFTGGFIQTVNSLAMLFIGIPYYVVFHWKFGGTPGKRLLRIRVVRESDGSKLSLGISFARYGAQVLSMLPFGAGYLMAAWNPKKQALHDTLAGTVSIIDP